MLSTFVLQDLSGTLETFGTELSLDSMQVVLEFPQLLLLQYDLLLLSLHGEWINAGLGVLGLVLLKPVVLGLDLLLAVGAPPRDPVIGNRVENDTRALLAGG